MKILILMTQFHQLNGAERLGVELAEGLNSRPGFRADIASIYGSDLPGVIDAEVSLKARGVKEVHYLNLQIHPRPWPFIKAILRLRRLLRTRGYDVVETSQATPAILASWAAWGTGVRHVSGIHDVFSRDRYNSARHKVWRFSVRGGRCARFYAISEYVKKHWVKYTHSEPEKTETILNAIPDDCFNATEDREGLRSALCIPQDTRIALFVGRMLKRKGIDTILEALGPILHDQNLCIVYVGEWGYAPEGFFDGEASLKKEMEERIMLQGWTERVRFLGRREDVPQIMASSDVLVHPARIEGFGLVLAEALAVGLPVVASTVQGIPEVLEGSDSLMTPPESPEAFRDAVLEVLRRGPEEAKAAALRGRARAERFRIGNRLDALTALFARVVEDR